MKANAKVAKQNGYTGEANGDMGGVPTSNESLSEREIQNEINQKANTEEGAEVIRRLGQQGIKVEDPSKAQSYEVNE